MPIEIVRWSDGGFDGGRGQAAQHRCPCFASKPTHTLPPKNPTLKFLVLFLSVLTLLNLSEVKDEALKV